MKYINTHTHMYTHSHAGEEIEQLVVVDGRVPKVGIRQTDGGSPGAGRPPRASCRHGGKSGRGGGGVLLAGLSAGGLPGRGGGRREGAVLLLDGLGEGIVLPVLVVMLVWMLVLGRPSSLVMLRRLLVRRRRRLVLDLGHLLVLEGPHLVLEPPLGPHVALHHVVLLEDGRGAGLDGLLAVVVGAEGLVMVSLLVRGMMMAVVVMVVMVLLLRSIQVGRMDGIWL